MKKILLLGAAVFALQAIPAFAEDAGKKPHDGKARYEGMFTKQDTDSDGVVSETEFLTHAKAKFDAIDANKDGKITKEEGKAHHEAMKKEWEKKRAERKAAKGNAETKPVAPKTE